MPGFREFLSRLCREEEIDLIHNHGCWLPINSAAVSVARRLRLPLVFTPHGMLRRWALRHNRLRKRVAWTLYQARDLRGASLIHVTSVEEGIEVRELGLRNPVAVIPHGVPMPPLDRSLVRREPRTALFLGRLHPVKGVENLLEAWAAVRPRNWRLVLAGPDEAGYQKHLEGRRDALRLGDSVEFSGPVSEGRKWTILQSASLFVLPSFTENFGLSAAEAMASALPVITTKGTPWQEIEKEGCGWWVEVGVGPLVAALREATDLVDEARLAMGTRGRALVARKYGWPAVGQRMLRSYEWLLRGGAPPDCLLD
jgi:glycosyltransferase involved in cell wall biosynthesis